MQCDPGRRDAGLGSDLGEVPGFWDSEDRSIGSVRDFADRRI